MARLWTTDGSPSPSWLYRFARSRFASLSSSPVPPLTEPFVEAQLTELSNDPPHLQVVLADTVSLAWPSPDPLSSRSASFHRLLLSDRVSTLTALLTPRAHFEWLKRTAANNTDLQCALVQARRCALCSTSSPSSSPSRQLVLLVDNLETVESGLSSLLGQQNDLHLSREVREWAQDGRWLGVESVLGQVYAPQVAHYAQLEAEHQSPSQSQSQSQDDFFSQHQGTNVAYGWGSQDDFYAGQTAMNDAVNVLQVSQSQSQSQEDMNERTKLPMPHVALPDENSNDNNVHEHVQQSNGVDAFPILFDNRILSYSGSKDSIEHAPSNSSLSLSAESASSMRNDPYSDQLIGLIPLPTPSKIHGQSLPALEPATLASLDFSQPERNSLYENTFETLHSDPMMETCNRIVCACQPSWSIHIDKALSQIKMAQNSNSVRNGTLDGMLIREQVDRILQLSMT